VRFAEHLGPHAQALAHLVAGRFSHDTILAIDARAFMPPVVIDGLPQSLLNRFESESMSDRLTQALRWIAPLSRRMPIA